MKIFFNLSRFVTRVVAGPDFEDPGRGKPSQESPCSEGVLLIGLRSPGDQLHVVAIKPFRAREPSRSVAP
jgi:hypothetical protein